MSSWVGLAACAALVIVVQWAFVWLVDNEWALKERRPLAWAQGAGFAAILAALLYCVANTVGRAH